MADARPDRRRRRLLTVDLPSRWRLSRRFQRTSEDESALVAQKQVSAATSLDFLPFAPGLTKTRSGKIMRRILREIAENDFVALGDTSTLVDPGVVDELVAECGYL